MKYIYIMIALLFAINSLTAKEIYVFDAKPTVYPEIKMDLMAFDDEYNLLNLTNPSDLEISDNGVLMTILRGENKSIPINDYSVVFLFDLSLDTKGGNKSHFVFAKDIIKKMTTRLLESGLNAALCSYDYMSYMNMDYTTDLDSLTWAIDSMKSQEISYFDRGLNQGLTSAFSIANVAKSKKIVVLITDGYSNINVNQIVSQANQEEITIYVLNLSQEKINSYNEICQSTGGYIVNNTDAQKPDVISSVMYYLAKGYRPFSVDYNTNYACDNAHKGTVNLKNDTKKFNFSYIETNEVKPYLESKPKYIGFSAIDIGEEKQIDVKLIAHDGDIYIRKIEIIKGDNINIPPAGDKLNIVAGGTGGFLLQNGQSHTISIKYKPTNFQKDSALIYTQLMIDADACYGKEIPITAGFPSKGPIGRRTIDLVYPYKAKKLFAGDSVKISWKGLLPEDMVHIAFSPNNGKTWDTIFNIYGKYNTLNSTIYHTWCVKDTTSDSCLFKIIQLWPNHLGKTIVLRHDDEVNTAFFSHDMLNKLVVTSSNDKTIRIWNSDNGQEIRRLEGHTAAVNYAEFSLDDKYVISASDDMKAILWDAQTGAKLAEFKHDARVSCARFTRDGKYIVTSGHDGFVKVWDRSTYTLYRSRKYIDPTNPDYRQFIYHFDLHPIYQTRILSSNSLGKVSIWDYEANKDLTEIDIKKEFNKLEIFQIPHCAFNEKGDLISITTALTDHNVCVWNYVQADNTATYRYSLDTSVTNAANSALFQYTDKYGEMLLISCGSNKTLIWDALNNKIHNFFQFIKPEHSGAVTTSIFNFDTKVLLTASMDNTARLWNLDQNSIQVDTSDYFSIGYPELEGKKVNFDYMAVNFKRDSVIPTMITNTSKAKITISGVNLSGPAKDEYAILKDTPNAGFELDSAETKLFELRFAPVSLGDKECKINFTLKSNVPQAAFDRGDAKETYSFDLIGNAYQRELVPTEEFLDFGQIELGDVFDIEKFVMIENKSPKDITISEIYIDGYPNKDSLKSADFKIVDKGVAKLPYVLASGGKLPVKLRFVPLNYGRKNAQLHYTHDGNFGEAKINLYGECVKSVVDSITISVNDTSAKPGDRIKIPIYAENAYIAKAYDNITGFTGYLKFNATILAPLGQFELDTIVGNWHTLKLNLPKDIDSNGVLTYLEFDVGLGNDTISPLTLEHFAPVGRAKVKVTERSATFKLNGVCLQGKDPRLVDLSGKLELLQNIPNPIIGQSVINYELIEDGQTKLYITDVTGRTILVIENGEMKKGKHSANINAEVFNSGKYFYILETPSRRLTKSFEVTK
ncbi:MAG: VWA domain-containing protein [bacterium]